VVPILLIANLFFGIYVNLSIWYKLTDRTLLGAVVSLGGAAITIILNIIFIPKYGYMASAWATLACYGTMAVASYILGQKYYPVAYSLKKNLGYILCGLLLWLAYKWVSESIFHQANLQWIVSTFFMLVFFAIVWFFDGRKLFAGRDNS